MIQSFKSRRARWILDGASPGKGFPPDLVEAARRRLNYLNRAKALSELSFPAGNRLHALKGERSGQWSISINDQWRICFEWGSKGPEQVEIVDYH